jgi:hypothetical protein
MLNAELSKEEHDKAVIEDLEKKIKDSKVDADAKVRCPLFAATHCPSRSSRLLLQPDRHPIATSPLERKLQRGWVEEGA